MWIQLGISVDIVKRQYGYCKESLRDGVDIVKTVWTSLRDGVNIVKRRCGYRKDSVDILNCKRRCGYIIRNRCGYR